MILPLLSGILTVQVLSSTEALNFRFEKVGKRTGKTREKNGKRTGKEREKNGKRTGKEREKNGKKVRLHCKSLPSTCLAKQITPGPTWFEKYSKNLRIGTSIFKKNLRPKI